MYTPDSTSHIKGPSGSFDHPSARMRGKEHSTEAFEKVMSKGQKEQRPDHFKKQIKDKKHLDHKHKTGRDIADADDVSQEKEIAPKKPLSLFELSAAKTPSLNEGEEIAMQEEEPMLFSPDTDDPALLNAKITKDPLNAQLAKDPLFQANELSKEAIVKGEVLSEVPLKEGNPLIKEEKPVLFSKTSSKPHLDRSMTEKNERPPSPFDLAARKPRLHLDDEGEIALIDEKINYRSSSEKESGLEIHPLFKNEMTDLSSHQPLIPQKVEAIVATKNESAPDPLISKADMIAIISQMVEKMSVTQTASQTDTSITLQHPPLFQGVTVVITSFETAHGEFNLAFENLTQAAKEMLDQHQNRETLKHALEERGYAVHIITTTTTIEHANVGEDTSRSGFQQQSEQDQSEEEKKRKKKDQDA